MLYYQPMTFLISVHGDNYSELCGKLESLAEERLGPLHLTLSKLCRHLQIAALPEEQRLGFFDKEQRIIVLSERLAQSSSWEDVSSVFLHELSHALDMFLHGTTGHTPDFRACCCRLGLSPEFSKSRVAVKLEKTDMKRAQIRKLMALSASSGYENEAAEAIRKAQRLMTEYGEAPEERAKVYSATMHEGKKTPSWARLLANYLAETCGVYSIFEKGAQGTRLRVYGSLEEVEFAVYLTTYVLEAAEREMARLRRDGERVSRPSFLYASIAALKEKTYDKKDSAALMEVKLENENLARRLVFGEKAVIHLRRSQSSFSDLSSFQKGHSFGSTLETGDGNKQKLIT